MIRNRKLKSGLEVVYYPLPQTRFVDIALAVGVGTRFETAEQMGISHFTEHIFFRGCKRYPTSYLINREFDTIGEGLTALTYKEFTLYTTRVPREKLEKALELLGAMLSEPLFADIETERGIIEEEILEELDGDGKDDDIQNISRAKIFGRHPLGFPVLGRMKTLKKLDEKKLKAFHARNYVPSNMVLAISGATKWEQALGAASTSFCSAFANAEPSPRPSKPKRLAPLSVKDLRPGFHFHPSDSSQVHVMISFFMPGELAPGELARLFISRILDDGLSSRLQRTVCERRGLLYDISCGIESFTDVALFDVEFSVSIEKLIEVMELVCEELKRLKREMVSADEFERVRGRFERDVYSSAENSKSMAAILAEAFLLKLPMPVEPNEFRARVRELQAQKIRHEALNAFVFEKCFFIARGSVPKRVQSKVRELLRKL